MIQIATGDPRPITRQIVDAVRMKIATGELDAGDQLPSVRGLAQQLMVNPNTVAKAYAELSAEGWLESRQGMGLYVAAPRQRLSTIGGAVPHPVGIIQRFPGLDAEKYIVSFGIFLLEVMAVVGNHHRGFGSLSQINKHRSYPLLHLDTMVLGLAIARTGIAFTDIDKYSTPIFRTKTDIMYRLGIILFLIILTLVSPFL